MSASFVAEDRFHVTQHGQTSVELTKRNRVYSVNYAGTVTDAGDDWLRLSGVTDANSLSGQGTSPGTLMMTK